MPTPPRPRAASAPQPAPPSLMDALTSDPPPVAPSRSPSRSGVSKTALMKAAGAKGAGASGAGVADEDAIPCAIFDEVRGRPCGVPVENGTLTCVKHRARATRTQISRVDAARRRGGR